MMCLLWVVRVVQLYALLPPSSLDQIAPGSNVTIQVEASDPDGQVVAWRWNFGDGSTATTANPSHTYSTTGTYTVSLMVSDNDNATSTPFSKSVTVSDSTGSICSGINEYPVGIGSYVGGSQVQNSGSLYQCKPFPYEGWCN